MYCNRCGKEVRAGAKYCNHCGSEIVEIKPDKTRKILITAIISMLCLTVLFSVGYFTGLFDRLHLTNRNTITEAEFNYCMDCNDRFLEAEQPFLDENGYVDKVKLSELLDSIESVVKEAEMDGEVDHYTRDDNTVFVTFQSGLQYLYLPPLEGVLESGDGGEICLLEPTYGNFYTSRDTFFAQLDAKWNQLDYQGEYNPEACAGMIAEQFSDLYRFDNGKAHLKKTDVSLDAFKNLSSYSVTIYEGHGAYNEEIHSCLVTGEYCSEFEELQRKIKKAKGSGDKETEEIYLTAGRNYSRPSWAGQLQFVVGSKFFDHYLGELTNSIVFLGGCDTLKDDTLAQTFLDHGASAVIGYSENVAMEYEMLTRTAFFYSLTQEKMGDSTSVFQAVDYAKKTMGEKDTAFKSSDGAELKILAKDGDGHSVTLRSILEPIKETTEITQSAEPPENALSFMTDVVRADLYHCYANDLSTWNASCGNREAANQILSFYVNETLAVYGVTPMTDGGKYIIPEKDLINAGYALFYDFDGALTDTDFLKQYNNAEGTYAVITGDIGDEGFEVVLDHADKAADGSVDAIYIVNFRFSPSLCYKVRLIPNPQVRMDLDENLRYYYHVKSVTQQEMEPVPQKDAVEYLGKPLSEALRSFGRDYLTYDEEGGMMVYYDSPLGVGFGFVGTSVKDDAEVTMIDSYGGDASIYAGLTGGMTLPEMRRVMSRAGITIPEPTYQYNVLDDANYYTTSFYDPQKTYSFVVNWDNDPETSTPIRLFVKLV